MSKLFTITLINTDINKVITCDLYKDYQLLGSDFEGCLKLKISQSKVYFFGIVKDMTDFNGVTVVTRIK